ncbi:97 kDa heat shock protein [Belonocnema kinseyi]|uniref:97 kDa heat shock protein n=1 Tax=Belonocnema kinseyi TaxID=2817044 RepID=UPI00143DCFB2|nr:97 kDa heat shock protein [Belonocnema kinseyi]XP_033213438.1 97 kDa heat shock protein [Belonocnema kinseyi]XP_033213439.1 97 kDa heat shock protein [Belonocnema kinseyi]
MAAMSVIGIDFGTECCYVAVARAGGIETIANDYSLRNTPSCVAFSGKNRILGVAAKNQMVTNMKNTIYNFKRLLGRKHNDPFAQQELQALPFKTSQQADGNIGIHVQYLGEEHIFSPEQITAMLFTKLKEISETALQTVVNDCVISVPSYFTQGERQALLDAAKIAGLNVLRLFNETSATALCYGIYKQDLPAVEASPRNVVFVDCGYASLQVCICAFHKGKLKMLASAADSQLGGRDIDTILAEHFCKDFQTRYKIDAHNNPRAYLRLLAEVEKLKKQMSANSTNLPLNIECFMEEKDVHGEMKRADMEAMCSNLFKRVELTLKQCLADSKLKLDDIHSVEIAGGSSRVPAIKRLIEEVFSKGTSTTLNQDEAVARGCALQCAMLSPAVRVRDFSVIDIQPYPIKLTWDGSQGEEGQMEVFGHNHPIPFSKMLTFYRAGPFSLTASYVQQPKCYHQTEIGVFYIKNVKPTLEGESSKVKVKVRVNLNGILTIASASLVEKREPTQQEKEEQDEQDKQQNQENNVNSDQSQEKLDKSDQEAQGNESPAVECDEKEDAKGKKKVSVRTLELPVEVHSNGFSQRDLDAAVEKEGKMIADDRQEKERVDVRNALEEYVYDLRSKLLDDDQLATFVTESDKNELCRLLDDTENWLYEEGEDCQRQIYSDRLARLKLQGEPIKDRRTEFEGRTQALEELGGSLQLAKKGLDQIRTSVAKDDKYCHITEEELKKMERIIQEKLTWLEEKRVILSSTPRTQQPPVLVAQIRAEKQSLDNAIFPILNKPKPKADPPKEEKSKEKSSENHKSNQNIQGDDGVLNNQRQASEEKMDVE